MKNLWILLLTVIFTFCACDNNLTTNTPPTSTSETTVTSATQPFIGVNRDLLSEIGMTAEQLIEKHGVISNAVYESGGPVYLFGTNDWYHSFGGFEGMEGYTDGFQPHTIPTDDTGNWVFEEVPGPRMDSVCTSIWYTKADKVFLGLTQPLDAERVAQRYGVTHSTSDYSPMQEAYYSSFLIDDLLISVQTDETHTVAPDSWVTHIKRYADVYGP